MYDKYFQATPITVGSRIPKHKGLLISGALSAGTGITLSLVTGAGGTFNTAITVNSSPFILPMQVYAIPSALPAGLTAFYIN
jgi:hypothetical protein